MATGGLPSEISDGTRGSVKKRKSLSSGQVLVVTSVMFTFISF